MTRAEFDWSEVPYPETMEGRTEALPSDDSEMAGVAAVLWVPDPEQRHWWREFYVKRPTAAKPGNVVGFGKPGER